MLEEYARMLSQALPPSITVAALNGHMRSTEKNEIMERFSKNEISGIGFNYRSRGRG